MEKYESFIKKPRALWRMRYMNDADNSQETVSKTAYDVYDYLSGIAVYSSNSLDENGLYKVVIRGEELRLLPGTCVSSVGTIAKAIGASSKSVVLTAIKQLEKLRLINMYKMNKGTGSLFQLRPLFFGEEPATQEALRIANSYVDGKATHKGEKRHKRQKERPLSERLSERLRERAGEREGERPSVSGKPDSALLAQQKATPSENGKENGVMNGNGNGNENTDKEKKEKREKSGDFFVADAPSPTPQGPFAKDSLPKVRKADMPGQKIRKKIPNNVNNPTLEQIFSHIAKQGYDDYWMQSGAHSKAGLILLARLKAKCEGERPWRNDRATPMPWKVWVDWQQRMMREAFENGWDVRNEREVFGDYA